MKRNIDTTNLSRNKIAELKTLGYNNCEDINSSEILLNFESKVPETKNAFEFYQEELLNGCILSYNEKLDTLLFDIITPKSITEFTGLSGSGKTQICFQLCTTVQLPKWCGGLEGEAIYISTNRNFASHRLKDYVKRFVEQYDRLRLKVKGTANDFNENSILKRIHYIQITTSVELLACFVQLRSYLLSIKVRLLIIDSISWPLRLLEVKNRIKIISKIFQELRNLANEFNFAVVLTNDLTTRTDEHNSFVTPSFGESFYHLVNSRILLSKQEAVFSGKLIKNTQHAQKEVYFYL